MPHLQVGDFPTGVMVMSIMLPGYTIQDLIKFDLNTMAF